MEDNNEDEYINDDCIIEDENYRNFKSILLCPLCNKILKNPMMCMNCQTNFCKKCLYKWCEDYVKCPNKKCGNPNYKENTDKLALLSLIKYRCNNCKSEVKYNDVQSHLDSGCEKIENECRLSEIIYKKKKLKKLNPEEIKAIKDNKKTINYITSKQNSNNLILLFILVISLGVVNVGKSSLINT